MLNIAICDDEKLWLKNTVELLNEYYTNRGEIPVKIHTFQPAYTDGSTTIFSVTNGVNDAGSCPMMLHFVANPCIPIADVL